MLRFKARPRKDPTESPFLTPSQRRVISALGSAMTQVRDATIRNEGKILDAILHGPPSRLLDLVPEGPWYEAQEILEAELRAELASAGQRYGRMIPPVQKAAVNFAFDDARPEAAKWASKESANLIVEVVEEQRGVVRDLASRASMGEMTPREAAAQVRNVIGLTSQQSGWVENFRRQQVLNLEAQGLSPAQVAERADRATDRYHKRIHRYRSENIARTEILSASHEGRRQAWAQGIEEGYIAPDSEKRWSANLDGRVCNQCRDLDGTTVPLAGTFPNGEPPLHPSCRCDVLLLPKQPQGIQELQALTDEELDAEIASLLPVQQPSTIPSGASVDEIRADSVNIYQAALRRDKPGEDPVLYEIYERRGYNNTPEVVSAAEMDKKIAAGYKELHRGMGGPDASDYVQQYKSGEHFAGRGTYGNGTYTSNDRAIALSYAGGQEEGMLRMALPPTAKTIDHEELLDMWLDSASAHFSRLSEQLGVPVNEVRRMRREGALPAAENAQHEIMANNLGRFAAAHGYDAIVAEMGSGVEYVVVLNRSVVAVQE